MECQFERNIKFKSDINLVSADELRSQPMGKDKFGNSYWSMTDNDLNLRIYQEHLDEDIWKVVANSREELVQLITCLKGNAMKMPTLVGVVDEDSSSNSMSAIPKKDALEDQQNNAKETTLENETKDAPNIEKSTTKQFLNDPSEANGSPTSALKSSKISNGSEKDSKVTVGAADEGSDDDVEEEEEDDEEAEEEEDEDDEDDESNISEIDESSQAASDGGVSTITNASKTNVSLIM